MDARDAQALLLRALDHYRGGALDSATGACLEVLGALPDHFDALNLLGVIRLRENRAADAADAFQRAIAARPGMPASSAISAWRCVPSSARTEALAAYDQAIAIQPGYAAAHANRGNALMDLGRFDAGRFRRLPHSAESPPRSSGHLDPLRRRAARTRASCRRRGCIRSDSRAAARHMPTPSSGRASRLGKLGRIAEGHRGLRTLSGDTPDAPSSCARRAAQREKEDLRLARL